jgi:hypothetical protein
MKDSNAFVLGSTSAQRVPAGRDLGMDDGVGEGTLWLVHQWGVSDVRRVEPGVLAGMCATAWWLGVMIRGGWVSGK